MPGLTAMSFRNGLIAPSLGTMSWKHSEDEGAARPSSTTYPEGWADTLMAAMPSALAMVARPAGAPDSEGASRGMSISSTTTARSCGQTWGPA